MRMTVALVPSSTRARLWTARAAGRSAMPSVARHGVEDRGEERASSVMAALTKVRVT